MQRYRGAPRVSALIAAIVRPHNWSTVAIPSEQVAAATYRRPPVNIGPQVWSCFMSAFRFALLAFPNPRGRAAKLRHPVCVRRRRRRTSRRQPLTTLQLLP
jgi:hypothetical protein